MIHTGTEVASPEQSIALAHEHRGFLAAVWLHPTYEVPDPSGRMYGLILLTR